MAFQHKYSLEIFNTLLSEFFMIFFLFHRLKFILHITHLTLSPKFTASWSLIIIFFFSILQHTLLYRASHCIQSIYSFLIFPDMYLKFLYKHTIHVNFPFKPNILFISGYTSIIFIEIVKSTIRANLPD